MNRWIRRTVTAASVASSLALIPAGMAFAQQAPSQDQAQPQAPAHKHFRGHHEGLIGAALRLDTLTPEQRSQIEGLVQQRKAARAPVRQADAQVLTVLAKQVEQASIDPQGLAPSLSSEQSAAAQQSAVERDTLDQLHGILSPAQRNQLVDSIEAARAQSTKEPAGGGGAGGGEAHRGGGEGARLGLSADQKAQIRANLQAEWQASRANATTGASGATPRHGAYEQALESFRGDSFDASALVRVEKRGERVEKLAQAMVPVLTPAQRSTFAGRLRARAAHASRS